MNYRAFGDFRKGYAHVKNDSGVEDYASSYNDPEGRFYIGVICDGHSDKNCFRSSKGAQFGCESGIEILSRFFELYLSQKSEDKTLPDGFENRLKRSLKLCWDRKVYKDLKENPLKEDELQPLTDRVRKIYEAGNGLSNIYGATFLAVGICENFFLALHIGDGAILCVDEDGTYYSPVPKDEKSETGAPASLCDSDLFTRENAFRIGVSMKLPQVATVSSDGIEDCMDSFEYKRFIYGLFKKIQMEELDGQYQSELNEKQKKYFESCLEYYADKGHGAEDDCSLSAIYNLSCPVPEVRLLRKDAIQLWERTMTERNEMVRDYENRKNSLIDNMKQVSESPNYKGGSGISMDRWLDAHDKYEDQKRALRTISTNETEKVAFYDRQLGLYAKYIDNFQEWEKNAIKPLEVRAIEDAMVDTDEEYSELKKMRQEYLNKQKKLKMLEENVLSTVEEIDQAYDEAKKLAKLNQDYGLSGESLIRNAVERHQKAKAEYEAFADEVEEYKIYYNGKKKEYFNRQNKKTYSSSFSRKHDFYDEDKPFAFSPTGRDQKDYKESDDDKNLKDDTTLSDDRRKQQRRSRFFFDLDWPWFF